MRDEGHGRDGSHIGKELAVNHFIRGKEIESWQHIIPYIKCLLICPCEKRRKG